MTSQISLHIEYLIQTYNILVFILFLKINEKPSLADGFYTILRWLLIVAYFVGPPAI